MKQAKLAVPNGRARSESAAQKPGGATEFDAALDAALERFRDKIRAERYVRLCKKLSIDPDLGVEEEAKARLTAE